MGQSSVLIPAWNSYFQNSKFLFRELTDCRWRNAFVGNDQIYIRSGCNQGSSDISDLSSVGNHNALTCLPHHGPMHGRLIRIICSQSVLGMNTINADENFVVKHLTHRRYCGWAGESKPVAADSAAGDDDFEVGAVTKFHGNIHCTGDDGNSFAMTNAAGHLRRRRSGTQGNNFTIANNLCRSQAYTPFLSSM